MSKENGDGGKLEMKSFVCMARQMIFLFFFYSERSEMQRLSFCPHNLVGDYERSKGTGTYTIYNYQHIENKWEVILNSKLSRTDPVWDKILLNYIY